MQMNIEQIQIDNDENETFFFQIVTFFQFKIGESCQDFLFGNSKSCLNIKFTCVRIVDLEFEQKI